MVFLVSLGTVIIALHAFFFVYKCRILSVTSCLECKGKLEDGLANLKIILVEVCIERLMYY